MDNVEMSNRSVVTTDVDVLYSAKTRSIGAPSWLIHEVAETSAGKVYSRSKSGNHLM